jgi:hypothetical protein
MSRKYYRADNRRAFYEARMEVQAGKCLICGANERLVIDHNHKTGLMRGLLCYKHNTALGLFQDNPILLRRAADYLESHTPEPFREVKVPTTAYESLLLCQELLPRVLKDEAFPSDRARARFLAEKTGCSESTAQTRLRRAKKKL